MQNESLINVMNPRSGSTVMICDVHASETGALSILDDLYEEIKNYTDKSVKWILIVSIPQYEETEFITVRRFPWVKKNWGYRYYFDNVVMRRLLKKYEPDQVLSLQNKGISFFRKKQLVYFHMATYLTEHKFNIWTDGMKLWMYQNIVCKDAFRSLKNVSRIIVQTKWMKEALIKKVGIKEENIIIQEPNIDNIKTGTYADKPENRTRFFYPATAFTYKNHMTILKAMKFLQEQGEQNYEVMFTISADENGYAKQLYKYAVNNDLKINFAGRISRERVLEMYTKSVLLFPSYVESFGLPLLEARLTGTPIIASNTPFCHEILDGYDKAAFFNEMDEKKLAYLIRKIICKNNRG